MAQLNSNIHEILTRTLKSDWRRMVNQFAAKKIGKFDLLRFIATDLARMEQELRVYVDLAIKQNQSATMKPVWEDNLRTKSLLITLLDNISEKQDIPEKFMAKEGKKAKIPALMEEGK